MSTDDWDALRDAGIIRLIAPGETVFEEGDLADGVYVVLDGRATVLEGDEPVGLLETGEMFGELGVLGDGVRTATVRAVEHLELLHLSEDQLHQRLLEAPELLWETHKVVIDRVRRIVHRTVAFREEHVELREQQRSLLPDLPQIDTAGSFSVQALWEPCTYASGDYYDVVPIGSGRHLVVLGDVMGHGAQSSLMMAVARAEIHELARLFRRTDELLLNLDGYLRDNAPPRQGMTLVVAAYARDERLLEYSIAGHPPPMLLRDGEVSDLPGRGGILLGTPFLVGSGYERHEIELERGDRLFLYSDGLYEVPVDEEGTLLGRERLAELLVEACASDPDEPLQELSARVAELDVHDEADDDRSALLLSFD